MLTHIDDNNQPTMVDVTTKIPTLRIANAQSLIKLPEVFRSYLVGEEIILKKGPVFQTAIIAGTMAVKKTYEMIPFCHQIPVESCKFKIQIDHNLLITIHCEVKTSFKTGVEMEALLGASIAALTVYDMCKALSHEIIIEETKLLSKMGGKSLFLDRPTYGLVLTGGKSQRMNEDKALINYHGAPHAKYIYDILKNNCQNVFLSARKDQWKNTALEEIAVIEDSIDSDGPISGILSAFKKYPEVNWLVVACDLIYFNETTIKNLFSHYDSNSVATTYKNKEKDFPEALCTIYTPKALELFTKALAEGTSCPVKVLKNSKVKVINQTENINLANINTQDERIEIQNEIN